MVHVTLSDRIALPPKVRHMTTSELKSALYINDVVSLVWRHVGSGRGDGDAAIEMIVDLLFL
jgi:hypothetical protein